MSLRTSTVYSLDEDTEDKSLGVINIQVSDCGPYIFADGMFLPTTEDIAPGVLVKVFQVYNRELIFSLNSFWAEVNVATANGYRRIVVPDSVVTVITPLNTEPLREWLEGANGSTKKYSDIEIDGEKGTTILRAGKGIWAVFKKDMGGCSLDGKYPKGTVLFITDKQIKEWSKKPSKSRS